MHNSRLADFSWLYPLFGRVFDGEGEMYADSTGLAAFRMHPAQSLGAIGVSELQRLSCTSHDAVT